MQNEIACLQLYCPLGLFGRYDERMSIDARCTGIRCSSLPESTVTGGFLCDWCRALEAAFKVLS